MEAHDPNWQPVVNRREPKYGDHVIYVDPLGIMHDALVTAPWTPTCINVVFVTKDQARNDSYGRQIERSTSLTHMGMTEVWGNYWRFPDEPGKPTEK